ncbi:hypothetical protein [Staphylococcus gallinarum]|uniref:hypothetical protein n=1 Tax=Staphylococcus gallinarum TaxID=1293 RepID=UPI000D1F2258|nr:hypothetical protein [Staphylococcus gallinarum]MBU7218582.1 hypothetical protein [Staphylococcus gallinarum]MCD8794317.1 hypothetical protein [Staphylococcus gallinarum]PTK88289.1 hypothetical protein BUZ03_13610 [Staphylococcus gallinarum]RIO82363.1 hypothetical protein BUZ10_12565 [Staphylococcus gallinarum]
MFAYVPIYDNGEDYEYHQTKLGRKIYIQKNSVVDYIKNKGFIIEETFPSNLDTNIEEYEGVRYYKEPIENVSLKSVTGKLLDSREYMYIYEMKIEQD